MTIATGFDLQPLDDGTILIEFFGEDGKTTNKQTITKEVLHNIPIVVLLTVVAMQQGPKAAKKLMRKLTR
jgi:hypothetical protein